jgi:hypothetical protein
MFSCPFRPRVRRACFIARLLHRAPERHHLPDRIPAAGIVHTTQRSPWIDLLLGQKNDHPRAAFMINQRRPIACRG